MHYNDYQDAKERTLRGTSRSRNTPTQNVSGLRISLDGDLNISSALKNGRVGDLPTPIFNYTRTHQKQERSLSRIANDNMENQYKKLVDVAFQ